jgi:hypothetical protein
MDDTTGEATVAKGARRPRQGEAFWREMIGAWKASGRHYDGTSEYLLPATRQPPLQPSRL